MYPGGPRRGVQLQPDGAGEPGGVPGAAADHPHGAGAGPGDGADQPHPGGDRGKVPAHQRAVRAAAPAGADDRL